MTMAGVPDPAVQGLSVYIVGGAVRDALLGQPAGDRDWVVVGATPEDMAARGFIPVGGDFPVFLHPRTKEEYALARTERKSGRGYKGFTFHTGPDVSLEDDLQRRDLTVNAIAQRPDGTLVDPLNGQSDISNRILRHVGQAFAEDPVRLLRLARFSARFHEFSIAPETMGLACRLVTQGEVDALVPERVWQEVAKGLMAEQPGRMFDVLAQTGALPRVLPGLELTPDTARELACASREGLPLAARFAVLCRLSSDPQAIGRHVRAPGDCQDYARLFPLILDGIANGRGPDHWLDLLERVDALRKPERSLALFHAAQCVTDVDPDAWRLRIDAIRGIAAGSIATKLAGDPQRIKQALREARLQALESLPAAPARS